MSQTQRDNQDPMPGLNVEEMARQTSELSDRHREFVSKLAERQSLMIPAEDPDFEDYGPAFPAWAEAGKGAILQPPRPQIHPSEPIMERIANRSLDIEAVD
jgi:hypothetical protein